jgi:hypothetical protein
VADKLFGKANKSLIFVSLFIVRIIIFSRVDELHYEYRNTITSARHSHIPIAASRGGCCTCVPEFHSGYVELAVPR